MPSITINNQTLTYNNIYYVDPVVGLDTNNGNSTTPFRTLSKAVTMCASTGDAIYAMTGTHDVTGQFGVGTPYGTCGVQDSAKSISFIGNRNNTIFSIKGTDQSSTPRDVHAICTTGTGTKFYNIIFNFDTGTRSAIASVSIFGNNAGSVKAEVYNCVFNHSGSVATSWMYDNNNASTIKVVNCTVKTVANMQNSYSGATTSSLTVLNTACNFALYAEGRTSNNLNNASLSAYYKVISAGFENAGTTSTFNGVTPTNDPDGSAPDIGAYGGGFTMGDNVTAKKALVKFETVGQYRMYNSGTSTWDVVPVNNPPTVSDFMTYGANFSVISSYPTTAWDSAKAIDNSISLLAYSDTQNYVPLLDVHRKAVPITSPIIMSNTIALSAISNIDYINIVANYGGGGAVYVLLSPDGTNWYTFNGTSFSQVALNTITTNGVAPSVINGMTSANWESFRSLVSNGAIMIKFAFALNMNATTDLANIDQVTIQADMQGGWVGTQYGVDYKYKFYNDFLLLTFLTTGDYKINY